MKFPLRYGDAVHGEVKGGETKTFYMVEISKEMVKN